MAANAIAYVVVVIVVLGIIAYAIMSNAIRLPGKSVLAIQLTDPPKVPPGTQALLVTYSSIEVHTTGTNQSGWVTAQGSGTVNLLALANSSKTIANAYVAANSTVNLVRFNVTSAQIIVSNSTYNISVPSNQVNVAITGNQKINSSGSSAVLIDFYPTVNAQGNANAYVMAPAARAILINSNATININANIGSIVSIVSGIKLRLGMNGTGSNGNNNGGSGHVNGTVSGTVTAGLGSRVSNFVVQSVNYANSTVTGLLYIQYPVASSAGVSTTLHVNSSVGYACDNTLAVLTKVNANNTATFTTLANTSTRGGCPI
ncbi:MAG: DUF4382 domain-containing protein [Candidatus Micrarchaeota archaeon]|nr:DUF4382 domain-containing protein [Candidatus Micrarchaeota archaeon]